LIYPVFIESVFKYIDCVVTVPATDRYGELPRTLKHPPLRQTVTNRFADSVLRRQRTSLPTGCWCRTMSPQFARHLCHLWTDRATSERLFNAAGLMCTNWPNRLLPELTGWTVVGWAVEADLRCIDRSWQRGKEQTTDLDRSGFGWTMHSQCNISRIECKTNENEHLIW